MRKLMRLLALPLLATLCIQGALGWQASLAYGTLSGHERLKLRNDFKNPEDVVRYYCARDASGFIWSGLLESERRAFTLWREVPQHDSFYVARKYEIRTAKITSQDQAQVEVIYDLVGVSDGNGTLDPSRETSRRVVFNLKRIGGQWKIAEPDSGKIAPVVLESKFPFATASR